MIFLLVFLQMPTIPFVGLAWTFVYVTDLVPFWWTRSSFLTYCYYVQFCGK